MCGMIGDKCMIYEKETPIFQTIDKIFIVLFFISFINSAMGTIFCILLLGYIWYGVEGEVKALLFLTLRGILSPAIAAGIGNGIIKWIVLLGMSILVILYKYYDDKKWKIQYTFFSIMIFAVIVSVNSFFKSSYPVTSCFKMLAFLLTFCATIKGVYITRRFCRWTDFLCLLMSLLMIISFFLIPFPRFRIVNDNFQGIFNHVNLMGVMCCVYLALVLKSNFFNQRKNIRNIVIICTLSMAFLSASRTGMISSIVVLISYNLFKFQTAGRRVMSLILGILVLIFITMAMDGKYSDNIIMNATHNFIWKDSEESILDSREEVIENAKRRYEKYKITGTGFMVPYIEGEKNYSLDFNLIVEPGNLYYMLLGDTGVAGMVLFIIVCLAILNSGSYSKLFLFISALLINMGEMAFFSSNNYSILLYFLLALYMFDDDDSYDKLGIRKKNI